MVDNLGSCFDTQSLAGPTAAFIKKYVSDSRLRQARTWAMLYVNSMKCLISSTLMLSFLPSSNQKHCSRISFFEYFLLWCSMVWLPMVAVYLIVACIADYFGISAKVSNIIDDALRAHEFYGLSPSNAAAALYDPPKFLGYIKVHQSCETKEDGQGNLRIADACLVDGTLHYKLHPKKAAAILGFNNCVPSNYVRSTRLLTEAIKLELVNLKHHEMSKDDPVQFDRDVGKLMTRFCALSYEISKLSEGLEAHNSLEFTLLERFGFPSNVKCQVVFQDRRWPQNHVVAFWCPEDHWIVLAFKGAVAWNIEKQMLNVCNDTVTLKNGEKCHKTVWEQLCSRDNNDIPYDILCKELDTIYQAHWASGPNPVLFVTGQGIGGSIAELFFYMKLTSGIKNEESLIGYTFGALGIGDDDFCSDFNNQISAYKSSAVLFTVHNSLDLFATLPVGLKSPGRNIDLYLSWDILLDTPLVHLTDFIFWMERHTKSFFCSQGRNILDAIKGDHQATLSIIFWLWCNPPKPFCDRMPISYFRNLDDPDIRIVESEAPENTDL